MNTISGFISKKEQLPDRAFLNSLLSFNSDSEASFGIGWCLGGESKIYKQESSFKEVTKFEIWHANIILSCNESLLRLNKVGSERKLIDGLQPIKDGKVLLASRGILDNYKEFIKRFSLQYLTPQSPEQILACVLASKNSLNEILEFLIKEVLGDFSCLLVYENRLLIFNKGKQLFFYERKEGFYFCDYSIEGEKYLDLPKHSYILYTVGESESFLVKKYTE